MGPTRDHQLVWGGLLIGLALGLYFGLILLLFAVQSMMHHMFIMGVRWGSPGFVLLVLLLAGPLVLGAIFLRRGLRNTHDR
jgi:hypothetical protein